MHHHGVFFFERLKFPFVHRWAAWGFVDAAAAQTSSCCRTNCMNSRVVQFSLGNDASRALRACWSLSNPLYSSRSSQQCLGRREWMFFASRRGENDTTQSRFLKKRRRLDEVCVERFPQFSRSLIQSWILQGKVLVDGKSASKAGMQVLEASKIDVVAEIPRYVCRAGYKLEAAIEHFRLNLEGKIVLDSGLSTGGFTDCLLQHGAAFVYGIDVGYGQVAEKIRIHNRVRILERTNLRYLSALPEMVDLVTLDLSFISVLLVMPAVCAVMKPQSSLITLIKPQFEARRSQVGGGGVVRDTQVHKEVLERVVSGVENFDFHCKGWIESPIKGAEGNIEFLALFERSKV